MRRIVVRLVVLALVLTPVASWAAGTLHYAGRFYAGGGEFDIAHYADGRDKVAVVGIKTNQQATSVAFAPGEWHSFAELWVTARGTRSATWQFIGTFKETGNDDAAQLSVAAGPGVQLTITGRKGPFVFVLSPRDYAAFDATVRRTATWLAH